VTTAGSRSGPVGDDHSWSAVEIGVSDSEEVTPSSLSTQAFCELAYPVNQRSLTRVPDSQTMLWPTIALFLVNLAIGDGVYSQL